MLSLFRRKKAARYKIRRELKKCRPQLEALEDRQLLSGGITEFAVPPSGTSPRLITVGPDGNLWFTDNSAVTATGDNTIRRMNPAGEVTGSFIVTPPSNAVGIVAGPDRNLWFTEYSGNNIGQMSVTGTVMNRFSIPTANSSPTRITVGSDGNLWFSEQNANKIGRITITGTITEFTIPTGNSFPHAITVGPDGNIWFAGPSSNRIGRVNLSHNPIDISEFTIPTSNSLPVGISAGPDGNLCFTEYDANKIGRMNADGVVTGEWTVPTSNSRPFDITAGPDGNLWFCEANGHKIGRITTSGLVSEFTAPTPNSRPQGIITGPDGNLWFTENAVGRIGRLTPITTVAAVLVNDGSAQRSMVNYQIVGFDSTVTLAPGAFEVRNQAGSLVDVAIDSGVAGGKTWALVVFTGPNLIGGSLADGNYTLTIRADRVTDGLGRQLDGNGDGVAGGNYVMAFHRLFGDTDGDRDVDLQDLDALFSTYGSTSADAWYLWYLDYQHDGTVDLRDYLLGFRGRLGTSLQAP